MNCTGKNCIMQYDKVDPATCPCVPYCPQATPPKTNADRIRALTNKELVSIIDCPYGIYPIEDCKKPSCWSCKMEWLKEEVKDEAM